VSFDTCSFREHPVAAVGSHKVGITDFFCINRYGISPEVNISLFNGNILNDLPAMSQVIKDLPVIAPAGPSPMINKPNIKLILSGITAQNSVVLSHNVYICEP